MPGEFRVKESCAPCKKRKSKCDAQQPCASCILRNTHDRCQYANDPPPTSGSHRGPDRSSLSVDHRASPYPRQTETTESSVAPTKRAMLEIAKLKASIHHLEGHVRDLGNLENALVVEDEPATSEEKANWNKLLACIPPKAVVEVLLEYLIQECDWLWPSGDILGYWQRACRRGGAGASTAGLLAMSLSLPAHMLGRLQGNLYRLPLDTPSFHPAMFELSRSFAVPDPSSLLDLEHYSAMILYQVYSGRHDHHLENDCYASIKSARESGWLDEGSSIWQSVEGDKREAARRIIGTLVSNYTWTKMIDPTASLLDDQRVNLCRSSAVHPFLKGPIELDLPGSGDLGFRVFRTVCQHEKSKSAQYTLLMTDIDVIVTEIRTYQKRLARGFETEQDRNNLAAHCQSLYASLFEIRERKAPRLGFSDINLGDLDLNDPASARSAAMALVIHNAIGFLSSSITRAWLIEDPRTPAEQSLHDACLEAGTRAMSTMEVTKALVATRNAPFVPAFSSGNLFNSATSFAVPVLRAVKLWTTDNRDDDIIALKLIPNLHHYEDPATLPRGPSRNLPPTIYIDGAVRTYANNILLILDTLKALNISPLGAEAEKRLSMLIQKFGLRDSQEWDIPFQPDMTWNGNVTWTTPPEAEQPMDPAVFNQLLLLDNSIWQGLMDPAMQPMP